LNAHHYYQKIPVFHSIAGKGLYLHLEFWDIFVHSHEFPVYSYIYSLASLPPKNFVALNVSSFSNKSRSVKMALKESSSPPWKSLYKLAGIYIIKQNYVILSRLYNFASARDLENLSEWF
jgi:hypothetical protein